MLEIRSVSKSFGGMKAVDDLSASVERGEIVLKGKPIQNVPPHTRIRLGLGRTFQIPRPFAGMTVLENVVLAAQGQSGEAIFPNWFLPGRVAAEERRNSDKATALLKLVELTRLAHEPARNLSGGQRKLLELARILMADPEIILLDEPAAGVNPTLIEVLIAKIAEINRRGVTFLIVEHNMDLVSRLCGRVLVMAAGRIMCEGAPAEVARDPRVVQAFVGSIAE